MTTELITEEGGRIIAVFDGFKHIEDGDSYFKPGQYLFPNELNYHKDWNLLMPVVIKIGSIPSISIEIKSFTVENGNELVNSCHIYKTYWPKSGVCEKESIISRLDFENKIKGVELIFYCVIKFIQWYQTVNK
jgi:hypothetical protein